jgi:hypothetical protein
MVDGSDLDAAQLTAQQLAGGGSTLRSQESSEASANQEAGCGNGAPFPLNLSLGSHFPEPAVGRQ